MSRYGEKKLGDAELLQGTLDMLILKIAALRPIHGYAMVQRIQQISREALQIRQGSLYPALYRLENRGWLKSEWKTTEGGREAKYYSLTKEGRKQLETETGGWKRLCEAICGLGVECTDLAELGRHSFTFHPHEGLRHSFCRPAKFNVLPQLKRRMQAFMRLPRKRRSGAQRNEPLT